jgi:hypothetical protein
MLHESQPICTPEYAAPHATLWPSKTGASGLVLHRPEYARGILLLRRSVQYLMRGDEAMASNLPKGNCVMVARIIVSPPNRCGPQQVYISPLIK